VENNGGENRSTTLVIDVKPLYVLYGQAHRSSVIIVIICNINQFPSKMMTAEKQLHSAGLRKSSGGKKR
jgi:hypothetical protein